MATVAPTGIVEVFRTRKDCPYQVACQYAQSCHYARTNHVSGALLARLEHTAVVGGRVALGTFCLALGLAMSLTLFLIPIGVPLSLVGVALLASPIESARR